MEFFFFVMSYVVPIHTCLCFDLLPLHTGDAGQLHGFPQDSFCPRWNIDTYLLAQVDCRCMEMFKHIQLSRGGKLSQSV